VAHVPLYGGLASLVAMAFGGSLRGLRRGPWPTLWTLGAVGTYAIADEIHQRFVPDRAATVEDVGLDLLGAAIALGLIHLYARRRASFPPLPRSTPGGPPDAGL
jgi:VanZ family protein